MKQEQTLDLLGNPIFIGDTVVSYNILYNVTKVGTNYIRILKKDPSKTTRSLNRYCKEVMVVSALL